MICAIRPRLLPEITVTGTPAPQTTPSLMPAVEEAPPTRAVTYGKVLGACGAAGAALVGRLTLLPAVGALALGAAGSLLGPLGSVVGGVAGIGVGLYVELAKGFKGELPLGRMVGGALGGAVGCALGRTLGALHLPLPFSQAIIDNTAGFSMRKLTSHLRDVHYTSNQKLPRQCYDQVMKDIQPGDILLSTKDGTPDLALSLFTIGGPGNGAWLHGAIYAGNGHTVEANDGGVIMRPLQTMIAESHHFMVRRPRYTGPQQAANVISSAQDRMGTPFGFSRHLSTSKYYCTDLIYHSLRDEAPQIQVKVRQRFGMQFVIGDDVARCKDMDTVYSTGSGVVMNYIAKFA